MASRLIADRLAPLCAWRLNPQLQQQNLPSQVLKPLLMLVRNGGFRGCRRDFNRQPKALTDTGLRHLCQVTRIDRAMLAIGVLLIGLGTVVNTADQAIAADPPATTELVLKPDAAPLDVKALQPGNAPAELVTANSVSLTQLTIPSLWWLREQIAAQDAYGDKLIENWLAYSTSGSDPGRVDLVVNRQFWSLLDYLDRYAFIHIFGKAARDYGYNVRVFDGQATLLGASTCDFSTVSLAALQHRQIFGQAGVDRTASEVSLVPNPADAIRCKIMLESSGKGGLRGGSK